MLNASRGGKPPVKPNTAVLVVTVSVAAVSAAAVHLFADAVAADAADAVADVVHPVGRQGSPVVPVAVVVPVARGHGAAEGKIGLVKAHSEGSSSYLTVLIIAVCEFCHLKKNARCPSSQTKLTLQSHRK